MVGPVTAVTVPYLVKPWFAYWLLLVVTMLVPSSSVELVYAWMVKFMRSHSEGRMVVGAMGSLVKELLQVVPMLGCFCLAT